MDVAALFEEWKVFALTQIDAAKAIWIAGGWGMAAIAVDAIVLFGLGVHLAITFWGKGTSIREDTWRRWIDKPTLRYGPIGEVLDFVLVGDSLKDTAIRFQGIRTAELSPIARDLKIMKICVGVAPLLGLFGTVTGMLATFGALAKGAGGEKTMAAIAKGISEALITTETGLVVALPGLFFCYWLTRKNERYKAFLAQLETACTQSIYKRLRARGLAA